MKRTVNKIIKKADAILTGDWHLQDTQPIARTDDFWESQWLKLDFISNLQDEHNCTVLHSGDLFNHWKPSPMLLSETIKHLPKQFCTIYGNHDLPQHNLELANKCGINVLQSAGKLTVLKGTHWQQFPHQQDPIKFENNPNIMQQVMEPKPNILVWHTMTYQGPKPWPDCVDPKASKLLRKYPKYDLIVTGHNHIPFTEKYKGKLLVNPGSIFRTSASQQDHKPRVYLWYAKINEVVPVYLPIKKNVISRAHLVDKQERENRIDAFVNTLDTEWKAKMSFEDNIEEFRKVNKISKSVMEIVYNSIQ